MRTDGVLDFRRHAPPLPFETQPEAIVKSILAPRGGAPGPFNSLQEKVCTDGVLDFRCPVPLLPLET